MATQTQTITVALSPDVQLAKDTYVVRSVAYEHDLPLTAPSTPCKDEQTPFFARCRSLPPRARKAFTLPDAPALPSVIHKGSVIDVMNAELAEVDLEACEANGENAFFVCDLGEVWRAHKVWECAMQPSGPKSTRIEAFYGEFYPALSYPPISFVCVAVKCNPDPTVVRLLAALGLGFDCASQAEIALVLSLGVSPDRIIYANPCKAGSHIRHAAAAGVQLMTFDNHDELIKIAKNHPSARLVLRMLTDDEGSVCRLGSKFGAHLDQIRGLLERARQLNLNVVGVSFHVGSGCSNSQLYDTAIATAKGVFQVGKEEGFDMDFLDIGGGFGGSSFLDSAAVVRASIDAHFPKESGVRVIAEPGRFFVSEAFELATNIIARRGLQSDNRSAVSSTSEADEAIVMCTLILVSPLHSWTEIDRDYRLHQRRRIRRIQLHHVRPSSCLARSFDGRSSAPSLRRS